LIKTNISLGNSNLTS